MELVTLLYGSMYSHVTSPVQILDASVKVTFQKRPQLPSSDTARTDLSGFRILGSEILVFGFRVSIFDFRVSVFRFQFSGSTRWSPTLASKVILPHAIKFRALRGEKLVRQHPRIWGQRNPRTQPIGRVQG